MSIRQAYAGLKFLQSSFVHPSHMYSPTGEPAHASFVPPKMKMMSGLPSMSTRDVNDDFEESILPYPVLQIVVPPHELFSSSW